MQWLEFLAGPMDPHAAVAYGVTVGLAAIGLGLVILVAEPRAPAAWSLAFAFAAMGFAHMVITPFGYRYAPGSDVPRWIALLFPAIGFGISAWLYFAARTAQPSATALAWIQRMVAASVALWMLFAAYALAHPGVYLHEFYFCLERSGCATAGFAVLGSLYAAASLLATAIMVVLFTQRLDRAERARAVALAVTLPVLSLSAILPRGQGLLLNLVAQLMLLAALVKYHVAQGERAAFLSRFLSSEFTRVVRTHGADFALKPKTVELTAVCCDLRGFTRLSQLLASDQVVRMLGEYYDAIGEAVAEFGATLKDYAGDGAVILVGAPVAVADPAVQGLAIGRRLQDTTRVVMARWAGPEMQIGLGVGVATGRVTVGAIGSSARMEYTAIGPAVNLASRLCAQARDGEILADARTAELVAGRGLSSRGTLPLKSLGDVPYYACEPG